jgi:hypothetical protein
VPILVFVVLEVFALLASFSTSRPLASNEPIVYIIRLRCALLVIPPILTTHKSNNLFFGRSLQTP